MQVRCFLWIFLLSRVSAQGEESLYELTPQDGWFNNLIHPDWGAIDSQLLRKSKVAYSDGSYMPSGGDRPNPFDISDAAHKGEAGQGSVRNRTAFLVYFSQQVVEEILDAQRPGCPREFFNIPVPNPHILNPEGKDDLEMPVLRSRYDQRTGFSPNNPRQQLNEITPYLDGGLIYGTGKAWTDAIRQFGTTNETKGRLAELVPGGDIKKSFPAINNIRLPLANPPPPREHQLKPVARFWRLGNPRGNENPFLLAFGLLFFRYHNYKAYEIAQAHPSWNDELVFNEARKWTIAVHQKIVFYDWLPRFISINERLESEDYFEKYPYQVNNASRGVHKYNPDIHPGITQEFQTAAMRFGHTLVTPGTYIREERKERQSSDTGRPGIPPQPPWFFYVPGVKLQHTSP